MAQALKRQEQEAQIGTEQTLMLDQTHELSEERQELLKDIPYETVRKAWFTLSHLLLSDGARVADMGCDDGSMAYTMAVLNPQIKIIGVDKSKRHISKAKELYKRHNLEFKTGDVSSNPLEENSLDAIINSFILHEVYSSSRYNERIVSDTLKKQFQMLKVGGSMFIRDYACPPSEQMVRIEMPDTPSTGDALAAMSESDLLVWYAEHARPRHDPGTGGFFLEELPARFPKTRLFRLPYKWAYEFIMRKDDRKKWETELPMEYTFFTELEFRKELRALGARVQYSGPYWDERKIEERFEGRFRLYEDNGKPIGNPPTSFIAIAQKMKERKSLYIEERRPSTDQHESLLKITAMRNQQTGELSDIVTRNMEIGEILPYKVTEDGRLKIFLHDGIARSIINAVPRSGSNLDGKRWSSHMVEPVSFDMTAIASINEFDVKNTVRFSRDYLGLKPSNNAVMEHGPDYYPAPDYIDERIHTYYLRVESPTKEIAPKSFVGYAARFQARGTIRELSAQHILNAITIGIIPNARLEMQILSLYQHLGIKAENWTQKEIALQRGQITAKADMRLLLQSLNETDSRFQDVKGTTGQLRSIHSTFVEEGQSQGAITGLSSQDVDFVISDEKTVNTAVVLPLTSNEEGDMHAGFLLKHLPAPQRHEGNGLTISAPSFDLPPEITDTQTAKKFIAEKFNVAPEMVVKLGESYFSHVSITPQRIHPFAISVPPYLPDDPEMQFIPVSWFMMLWHNLSREPHFMLTLARAYRFLSDSTNYDIKLKSQMILEERFSAAQPDWSMPFSYAPVPREDKKPTPPKTQKKQAPKIVTPKVQTKATIADAQKFEKEMAAKLEKEIHEITQVLKEQYPDEDGPRPNVT
ncbi:MAG: hypothetical protein DHS20C02_02000 [Micavibrio sp.]|nr:MAG: hypothetical protein DHS20C02_02000 [Micavibrio sp.]